MTVRQLKEKLNQFNDDDRIILDCSDSFKAGRNNEVMRAFKHAKFGYDYAPVVVLQIRDDYDVKSELEEYIHHCIDNDIDEVDALTKLFETGYNLDDFIYYDMKRYKWAKRVATEHGLI